ncbi:MAG: MYXO-CTERM sorting domain-containing protein, partial [Kofleriaceae bacterium]
LNPTLGWLAQSIPVFVNENDTCNAFSNGDDIHFFRKSGQCENTGRIADVVYHEFGHSLHANSIIEGVGNFDGGLSEGISDVLAMAITGDPGMGRGFFFTNTPLRNLDGTKRWPEDATGEPHDDGEIIGETFYDLRKNLEAKLGADAGYEKFLVLMYSAFQRASDIPSSYSEALLADDDDGDLANGTPNTCEINAAFGKHGLADPSLTLGIALPTRDNFDISVQASAPSTAVACPGTATVTGASITWNLRGGAGGTVEMVKSGETFDGTIPTQSNGSVVQYKVTLTLSDASTISYPQNPADQSYEFFVGDVEPIKCFSFDSGGLDGWTVSSNQWEVGAPHGLSTDPKEAFAGTGVMGIDLSADGSYDPDSTQFAESPEIDLKGATKVRLQYRRWLGVEDGFYDQARILANGTEVWSNFKSATDPQTGGINHTDREWRFQDVDLATQAASGKVKLRFELASDQGLEFGGWTMDDVCIVAFTGNGPGDDGDGDGGCCSTGGDSRAPIVLGLMTLGLVVLRRRRK